ncbi:MAG: methionyl-tRNA formyltransferase [Deltaproteobacteria bacterium]|nr:methionyl-tRNA formyltransferase [Deltaproteobacteria bacterium]MBW2395386.1 methionyl-tRNA formyltransferase [Deltaproteobacteria bacterium]
MALKIAYFGQAPFGRDVLVRLLEAGHEIVGVYAPREGKRPDPLAEEALNRGLRLFRYGAMRRKGEPIAERVTEHAALGADLNVLAFVTMILPEAVVEAPRRGSLCFHPSLLPRFRGGNALAWQIIEGESEAGVSVFRPDAGVDTGPIVVKKGGVTIEPHHTAASLYFEQLYGLGVQAMVEAVDLVDRGEAEYLPQDESLASFQGLVDDEDAAIDWGRSVTELDRQIRGCDPAPGAHTLLAGQEIRLFGVTETQGSGSPGEVVGHADGAALVAAKGGALRVGRVRLAGAGKQPAAEVLEIGARLG